MLTRTRKCPHVCPRAPAAGEADPATGDATGSAGVLGQRRIALRRARASRTAHCRVTPGARRGTCVHGDARMRMTDTQTQKMHASVSERRSCLYMGVWKRNIMGVRYTSHNICCGRTYLRHAPGAMQVYMGLYRSRTKLETVFFLWFS